MAIFSGSKINHKRWFITIAMEYRSMCDIYSLFFFLYTHTYINITCQWDCDISARWSYDFIIPLICKNILQLKLTISIVSCIIVFQRYTKNKLKKMIIVVEWDFWCLRNVFISEKKNYLANWGNCFFSKSYSYNTTPILF